MRYYALLFAACLGLFLPGFFALPVTDRDEARYAQASRQMLETRDFVNIMHQDLPRHKTPAGIYWMQAVSTAVFGKGAHDSIWTYRIPSLTGAVMAVFATAALGTMLFDRTVGMAAGLILGATLLLGAEARLAKADAMLLATVAAAQAALARTYLLARQGRRCGRGNALLFWLFVGLSIFVKGPLILFIAGSTVACLIVADREWRWLRDLRPLAGIAVVLAIVLPWFLMIGIETKGEFFRSSLLDDLLSRVGRGRESHGAPPGTYLLAFWPSFWPFSLLAVLAVPWAFARRSLPAVRFCIAWILPTWVLFEAVASKLPHYDLPVFPAIALLTAAAWQDGFEGGRPTLRNVAGVIAAAGFIACGVIIAALLAVGPVVLDGTLRPAGIALALLALALPVYAMLWRHRGLRHRYAPLSGLIVGGWLFNALLFQSVLPSIDTLWVSERAAAAFKRLRPCPNSRLASAGYSEPSLIFLTSTDTLLGSGSAAAKHLLADPACAVALVAENSSPEFRQALARAGRQPEELATITGLNYARMTRIQLRLNRLN